MNKKMFFVLWVLIIIFSLSAVQAGDINSTDDNNLQIDDSAQLDDLKSDDANPLAENDKNHTELSPKSNDIYYKGSYGVTLRDCDADSVLTNKSVDFVINNVKYNAVTGSDGAANVKLNLAPGKYTVFASFIADDNYTSCNLTSTFNILPTIKAKDVSKYYKAATPYSAQFFDSNGHPLANTMVSIAVNGKSYSVKTNGNGIASLQVNLKPGSYKVVSTNPLMGYKATTTFTILPTITASNVKQVQGQRKNFKAKFLRSDGKPLANAYVKYKFRGKVHKAKTNAYGKIVIPLKNLKKGTYKIVCYNKDGFSKTYKIKIYKKRAYTRLSSKYYTFYPNDKRMIKVTLSTALGDDSNARKTIKITINSKKYYKRTDSMGRAYLDVSSFKKGIFKVRYEYFGDKFFKPSKLTRSLTIYPTTKTSLNVRSTTHFGYGAGTHLKLFYNAGGVPLIKKTVKLYIDGKTYRKTTDSKGMVSMPINLKIGKYTVGYRTNDVARLEATSGSHNIDVFKRSASKIIWKSGKYYGDNFQKFKVRVTDLKGKHVSGGRIVLKIDGENYYASVSSKGYAKFWSEVDIGNYKVSVKYKGNNKYLPSSKTKSIHVDISKWGNGINERNARWSYEYIKSSSHCDVGAAKIKKLVNKLTRGLKDDEDKAKAIFNYVRDTLEYSYYYDTQYGSVATLNHKEGNCVDHSHLLVAMFRTAGLNARYVHGTCRFSDGDVTGHVWTQVKIGNSWVCADAISYRNSLGKIKNWDIDHYTLHAKYASLPF